MLTITRSCQSSKILHLIRSYFSLLRTSFPILLHEISNNDEILLSNNENSFLNIDSGIYLAFIQYDHIRYQPLFDFTLVPKEIFPEKKFLPKSNQFLIFERSLFVKTLSNMIEYMVEYEKTKVFIPIHSPTLSNPVLISKKKLHTQRMSLSELSQTPLSTSSSSTRLLSSNHDVDIRKYLVTDLQRINNTISPFSIQLLNHNEQIHCKQIANIKQNILPIRDSQQFNENDLVIFKQQIFSLLPLDLKNCIHQLALDEKLDNSDICEIFIRLQYQTFHENDAPKIIRDLLNAASNSRNTASHKNLSYLMKTLVRIDQLEKFAKLDSENVRLFNERITHLAQMGILNQQTKILKKLFQLDLVDIQYIIPKQIPLNYLGIKEILHQLRVNVNRLGLIPTLILINNLQQINQTGAFLILYQLPELKRYLRQFIEHIQTGRCVGVYLQRLVDQMNHFLQIPIVKKVSFTNQLNSYLQQTQFKDELITNLFNQAYQGKLNSSSNESYICSFDNHLQMILVFLHQQPFRNQFIQYLRHYAQLGILNESRLSSILTYLHRAKDEDQFPIDQMKIIFNQLKSVDYLYAYSHLNIDRLNQFFTEMLISSNLTFGQVCYILDRLIDFCRTTSITRFDIENLLIHLQLEYHRQQILYPKLVESVDNLIESYSNALVELHSFERDLEKFLSTNTKRIPEDVRKRLNEIVTYSKQIRNDRLLAEQIFADQSILKFYNKIKEIIQNKNLLNRKQSLTAIVQIHKHFSQIARSQSQTLLNDQQLDSNFQQIEETIKNLAKLGYLQNKTVVEQFLSTDKISSMNYSEIQEKLRIWLLTTDFNHPNVHSIVKHLNQLENQNRIDTGTVIDIQNGLNRLARLGKFTSKSIEIICEQILRFNGKKSLADRENFQLIQSYRLIIKDILSAVEIEFIIEKLICEYQLSDRFYYSYREFVYRILQNDLSVNELSRFRNDFERILSMKYQNIEQIEKFIARLPRRDHPQFYPLTLSDKLFERLKYDGKIIDRSIRDHLLKFERTGILSRESFDEFFHRLLRNDQFSFEDRTTNELLSNLFDKINTLVLNQSIHLNQMIDLKEQLYLLEDLFSSADLSKVITIESQLYHCSNQQDFQNLVQQLRTLIHHEQFRVSKVDQLITKWNLTNDETNSNTKPILKLFHDLAQLNRLTNTSMINRYLSIKQITPTLCRNLIKDLQRWKIRALIERQISECIRSIEIQMYPIDAKKRLNESKIQQLENHFKQTFALLSRPLETSARNEIVRKLSQLTETYIQSTDEQDSFEQLLINFDQVINQMKDNQRRSSKIRSHVNSTTTLPSISSSLKSLQSL